MNHKLFSILSLILFCLSSCSEPFTFDTKQEDVDVIDARISTIPGKSNISIYRIINGNQEILNELEVSVLTYDGSSFDFFYNSSSLSYTPIDDEFIARVGESYKMIAKGSGNRVYESDFDITLDQVNFDIAIEDTIMFELTSSNRIIETEGIAFLAVIPPQQKKIYAKLDFKYTYRNFFDTSVVITRFNSNDFVLLNCDGNSDCLRNFRIPVGFKQTEIPWRFINPSSSCDTISKCPNPPDPIVTCCLPCCIDERLWNADYEISLKIISEQAYKYWENIERLAKNDGLIFDVNPFPIDGNVSCIGCENRVVGLFRAYSETLTVVNRTLP